MHRASQSIVLSNLSIDYQQQTTIVRDVDGFLSFASINRFALTLPSELTSEIFMHCLESEFIRPDPATAPLLLCRICRRWRRIAMDTPGLWASLYIDLEWEVWPPYPDSDSDSESESEMDLSELLDLGAFLSGWISRAGNMPLSIHVEEDPENTFTLPEVEQVLEMIGERSAQWRKIVLRVSPDHFRQVCPSDPITFPLLQHLAVPHIQISETPWMFDVPWTQLTVFRSDKISISECIHVLRNGLCLSSCTFSLCPEIYPVQVTGLPPLNLETLEITDNTIILLSLTLLQHLTLPALRNLALRFDTERHTHRDMSRLISFATRSAFPLQQLTLCLVPVPEALLIQCLHCFPSVTDLRLQLRQPADDLLRHLTCDVDLLPRLQSLHIVQNFPHPTVPDAVDLLEMLAKRWELVDSKGRPRTQLRVFQFEHSGSTAMQAFTTLLCATERFQLLEDQGMELDFTEAYLKRSWNRWNRWYLQAIL
ncbi:hypothetical protein DFH06DRAFT_1156583 [Mycena polygramma]|nr:hypothetical protein DFH06DRAFT_1156583 [Mycena polygramma]